MALNNLERYADAVDRAVLFATLAQHPGAAPLLARVGGASQFLADALRRRPSHLAWLLEPRTMHAWLAEDLAADLARALDPFVARAGRMNALRRFKYRHLLRIGARDLLGDADLAATTEELAHLADACLGEALGLADATARAQYGAPRDAAGVETGLAVVAMGKLGGEELNYASDVDLLFVYGADGETTGGPGGRLPNGDYFARVCREVVRVLEDVTDEGYAFRVDLRLRPEGRTGALILSLDGYRHYWANRAELWERQALLKARIAAGDRHVGALFMELARGVVYRPGLDRRVVPAIRAMMKAQIDRGLRVKGLAEANVKLGRGGIREIEFLVQALQLLYAGDDPWLRERNTLRAIFRLTERGYLTPAHGWMLSAALVHLRTVEHRLQILHEFQTHTLPAEPEALGRLARRVGFDGPPARHFRARHRAIRGAVHRAFRAFFAERVPKPRRAGPLPSVMALAATGFADPERARHTLRLLLEGRPLVPYAGQLRAALERLCPMLLDALWKSADPDEALTQVERFLSAAGPRAGLIELLAGRADLLHGLVGVCAGGDLLTQLLIAQPELLASLAAPAPAVTPRRKRDFRAALGEVFAPGLGPAERRDRLRRIKQGEELTIVWRYLQGVPTIDAYAREMTALAEAVLLAGWLLTLEPLVERHGAPRDAAGRFIPAVIVGTGKLGGRELITGSDLDLFVVFERDGRTGGADPIDAHWLYSLAAERLAGTLGDITAAGVAFPVDLRLRPGSKGSGFASSVGALEHYYQEYGDLWERQTLTRARLLLGDRALARRVRAALGRHARARGPDARARRARARRPVPAGVARGLPRGGRGRPRRVHGASGVRPRRDAGEVLGIDVGYSRHRKTTGFCALSWDRRTVRWTCRNAGTGAGARREVLGAVLPAPGRALLAVAIDGPLRPHLRVGSRYRCAESLLSRGLFQHRGKPGPSNGGSGKDLHTHATGLAHFILAERDVSMAAHVPAIHQRSIVEAFPTLFLGVLCDEVDYPPRARRKRKWTDTLYPATRQTLGTLLQSLLPGRRVAGDLRIKDHEKIVSFVCALTALCVATNRFVAVGAAGDGFIVLPPHELWGAAAQSGIPWAARELRANVGRVAEVLPGCAPVIYRDGTRWMG